MKKKYGIIMAMAIVFFTLCGCGRDTAENTSAAEYVHCTVTVGDFYIDEPVEVEKGGSVYDALKNTGAIVSAESTAYGLYVEGINGVFAGDEGKYSGWTYTVNGAEVNEYCSNCEVNEGDTICWTYVTE